MTVAAVPYGFCHCGCGERTRIATKTLERQRHVAGEPIPFVHGHNRVVFDRVAHFWSFVEKTGHCWVWTGKSSAKFGYGLIRWRYGVGRDKRPLLRAHRVSWELVNGPVPDGLFVLHKCDNPPCVNPEHLFLGTNDDNVADMWAKGRARNGRPPLPQETADEILRLFQSLSRRAIAHRLGISINAVRRVVNQSTVQSVA